MPIEIGRSIGSHEHKNHRHYFACRPYCLLCAGDYSRSIRNDCAIANPFADSTYFYGCTDTYSYSPDANQ
jgi:hypothetical protein